MRRGKPCARPAGDCPPAARVAADGEHVAEEAVREGSRFIAHERMKNRGGPHQHAENVNRRTPNRMRVRMLAKDILHIIKMYIINRNIVCTLLRYRIARLPVAIPKLLHITKKTHQALI